MRSNLILPLIPCVLFSATALTFAQPAPTPAPHAAVTYDAPVLAWPTPMPSPQLEFAVPPMVYQPDLAALDQIRAEVARLAQDGPLKSPIDQDELARLRTQTAEDMKRGRDAMREASREMSRKIGRSCGDGTIDSVDESDSVYDCGRQALDRAAWDDALQSFTRVAAAKLGSRAAGAVYWRAYSQNRLGQRAEALSTLGELKSAYPSSGWATEANALEVEIRQSSGQRVTPDGSDEDLKLLALANLANSDSDSALPLIENVLKGAQSPRVKERALFVLAQSNKPAARDVVVRVAKGGSNPDLQLKAVQFIGTFRSTDGIRVLSEIYGTSQDRAVRRAILRSYMMANAREPLVAAARQETNPELRLEAVRQLGMMKAGNELAELYAKETSPEVKKQILRGLAIGGQNDKLVALAQSETNPELRRTAIRSLGLNRDASTGAVLTQLYAKEQTTEVREAVLDALYTQGNSSALITLARQEKDPALKVTIFRRLSTMKGPEVQAYMEEILK